MKLVDINVPEIYKHSSPSVKKINKIISYYKRNGKFNDRSVIVLNVDNYIIDGYITYLAAINLGIDDVEVSYTLNKPVVYGKHPDNDKEYMWLLPRRLYDVKVGDLIYCNTKQGVSPVVITRIENSANNVVGRIKTVKGRCANDECRNNQKYE